LHHSRRTFLAATVGAGSVGASLLELSVLRAARKRARPGSRRRSGASVRHREGRRRRLCRARPLPGPHQLQRRHLRECPRPADRRHPLERLGGRRAGRPDPPGNLPQAGPLRRQHALPLGPHPGRAHLSPHRAARRHRLEHRHSPAHRRARRRALQGIRRGSGQKRSTTTAASSPPPPLRARGPIGSE